MDSHSTSPAPSPRVHLVLGGGGMKCLSYLGALSALKKTGISFASVAACSAGTLVGILHCSGRWSAEAIEAMIIDKDLRTLAGVRRWPFLPGPWVSLLSRWPFAQFQRNGMSDWITELLGDATFADLTTPLSTVAIDVVSRRFLVYSSRYHGSMKVADVLRISTAIPSLYPPYCDEIAGRGTKRIVVDAAIASPAPVWLAAEEAEMLPIVVLTPKQPDFIRPRILPAYILQLLEGVALTHDHYLGSHIPRARTIEIDCGEVRYDQLDLDARAKRQLIEAGRNAANALLDSLGGRFAEPALIEPQPLITDFAEIADLSDRAEAVASHRMSRRALRRLSRPERRGIFISYAHEDRPWMELICDRLRALDSQVVPFLWNDSDIPAGTDWFLEIQDALDATKVAVPLISEHFLESHFATQVELDYFLRQMDKQEVRLAWVLVSRNVKDHPVVLTKLAGVQAAYRSDKALDELAETERDAALTLICHAILQTLVTTDPIPKPARAAL